jgi:hypothetical protein
MPVAEVSTNPRTGIGRTMTQSKVEWGAIRDRCYGRILLHMSSASPIKNALELKSRPDARLGFALPEF